MFHNCGGIVRWSTPPAPPTNTLGKFEIFTLESIKVLQVLWDFNFVRQNRVRGAETEPVGQKVTDLLQKSLHHDFSEQVSGNATFSWIDKVCCERGSDWAALGWAGLGWARLGETARYRSQM